MVNRLLLLIFLSLLTSCLRYDKKIAGVVADCETGRPIEGATVSAHQTGWGFRGSSLVWDKDFTSSAVTDNSGRFALIYRVGDYAQLYTTHPSYSKSFYPTEARTDLVIGMQKPELSSQRNEITYGCTRPQDCEKQYREGNADVHDVTACTPTSPQTKP